MSQFIPSKKGNSCQVCGDGSGKCRSSKESDLLLCMSSLDSHSAPNGFRFIRPSKNGLWGIFAPDTDSSTSEDWEARREQTRREQEAKRAQRLKQVLSIEERDRQARAIAKHCGLPSSQHQADLQRRGLSAQQIVEANKRGLIFSWQSEQRIPGTTAEFPGIGADGLTRKYGAGYAIGVPDRQGRVLGFQIRLDSPNSGGKYFWLSSESVGGASPHLPSGELPIGFYQPFDGTGTGTGDRYLCEGLLKPLVASQTHGAVFIGSSGGNFAASPEQLAEYLEGCDRAVLCPDSGSVVNPHVMATYRRLNEVLAGQGRSLWVLWYGQVTKQDGDIDEIPSEVFQAASVISWEAFEAIAAPFLPQAKAEDQNSAGKAIGPDPQEYEAYLEWEREQELIDEEIDHRWNLEAVKQFFDRTAVKYFKKFGKLPERPKANTQQSWAIKYRPYVVPPAPMAWSNERSQLPTNAKLFFEVDQRSQLLKEAFEQGWTVFDISPTGTGKSHGTGTLKPEELGATNPESKLFWIDESHRNPSIAAIEESYWDNPVRHNGLKIDESRITANGRPHVRHLRKDEIPDIQANCHLAGLFHAAASKGYDSASETASVNPICGSCQFYNLCGKQSGDGYGYRHERAIAFQQQQIRTAFESMPSPDTYDFSKDVAVIEEAGQVLKPVKTMQISTADYDANFADLERELPDQYALLAPIKLPLRDWISGRKTAFNGLNDEQLREEIGPCPEDLDIDLIEGVLTDNLAAVLDSQIELADNLDGKEEARAIASLQGKIKRRESKLSKLQAELEAERDDKALLTCKADMTELEASIRELEAEISDLKAEVKELDSTKALITRFNRIERQQTSRRNRQAMKEVIEALPVQWLVKFLRIWRGDRPGAMRIGRFGGLILTERHERQTEILSKFKSVVFLDATMPAKRLALHSGLDERIILPIQQESQPATNLKVVQVTGFNSAGKKRSQSTDERLRKLIEVKKSEFGHDAIAVIDYLGKVDAIGADAHHFGPDSRGSNRFQDKKILFIVGLPRPDLATIYDRWVALGRSGDFDDYYKEEVDAALIQEIGRLRANRRLNEELTCYVIFDDERSKHSYALPVQHTVTHISDLCPDAASIGDRTIAAIQQARERLISEGKRVTQQAIAAIVGISQQAVCKILSKMAKVTLDMASGITTNPIYGNNKIGCKNPEKEKPDRETVEAIAQTVNFAAQEYADQDWLALLVTVFDQWLPGQWQEVWRSLTASAQMRAIEALTLILGDEEIEGMEAIA